MATDVHRVTPDNRLKKSFRSVQLWTITLAGKSIGENPKMKPSARHRHSFKRKLLLYVAISRRKATKSEEKIREKLSEKMKRKHERHFIPERKYFKMILKKKKRPRRPPSSPPSPHDRKLFFRSQTYRSTGARG